MNRLLVCIAAGDSLDHSDVAIVLRRAPALAVALGTTTWKLYAFDQEGKPDIATS